jgi:hypothetical protein
MMVMLQTYVLDVHPFNPRIAMSAGYDGRVIIWDVSVSLPHYFKSLLLMKSWGVLLLGDHISATA